MTKNLTLFLLSLLRSNASLIFTCGFQELVTLRKNTPPSCKVTKMATPFDFSRGMLRQVHWCC